MKKDKSKEIASYLQMLEDTFKDTLTYPSRKQKAKGDKVAKSYQPKIEFLFPKTGDITEASDS